MKRKKLIIILLLTFAILAVIPESLARQQYLAPLNAVYGNGSCGTCHVDPSGGGPRNDYGLLFQSQPDYAADPTAALRAIGAPPATNIQTPTVTLQATPRITPAMTREIPDEEENQNDETESQEENEFPDEPETPATETETPSAPGFGIVVSIAGLFILFLLRRR